jgi:hypothetical protein
VEWIVLLLSPKNEKERKKERERERERKKEIHKNAQLYMFDNFANGIANDFANINIACING